MNQPKPILIRCVLMLMLIILSSCSSRITEGEIITMAHEPPTSIVSILPMTTIIGKTTIITMIPFVIFDDEDWVIKIEKWVEDRFKTRTLYVSRAVYDSLSVGDYISLSAITHEDRDPDIKTRKR